MKIAIIGDFIIDEYINYSSIKLSPEAPCPIVKYNYSKLTAGGAANVANSLDSFGFDYVYIFCKENNKHINLLNNQEKTFTFFREKFFQSHKKRHCVDNKQLFREDKENISKDFPNNITIINKVINMLKENKFNYVLISDYQKGTLTENELSYFLKICKKENIKTLVDTKISNPKSLKDSYLLKPNLKEFKKITGYSPKSKNHKDLVKECEKHAKSLIEKYSIENVVLTMSQYGSVWYSKDFTISYQSSNNSSAIDIVGAGDSFLVALGYMHKADKTFPIKSQLKFATLLAETSISKVGTNHLLRDDLDRALIKIKKHDIGFTNGCFDIVHPGHISLLSEAKKRCNKLIVGINSDKSVRKLKGKNRPVNTQEDRLNVLKSIKYVDEVIIFEEDTPLNLIKEIKPDILFKGADYNLEEVVGSKFVKSYGGETYLVNLLNTKSTTDRINSINN